MASIPIADLLDVERLPIDAQDVITQARLVLAGNVAGEPPWSRVTTEYAASADTAGLGITFVPMPLTITHEHALHASIAAQRSLALPEGINPFLNDVNIPNEPTADGSMTNAGAPSAVRDGDPATYGGISDLAAGSGTLQYESLTAGVNTFYGFRLMYSLDIPTGARSTFVTGTPATVSLILASRDPTFGAVGGGGDVGVTYPAFATHSVWALPETDGEVREVYGLALFDARVSQDNRGASPLLYSLMSLSMLQQAVGGDLRVYSFVPLHPDGELLDDVALANVRVPAGLPQRVTVTGYVSPDREHTIVGWPGGDYTGVVAQHQYELGRTIIDFEQAGAPVGLPSEAIEAARERTTSTQAIVQSAGYSLKMGERQ